MAVEVVTFGLFLLRHTAQWATDPEVFLASQARLHVGSATVGTVVLLIGSFTAYQGALSCEVGRGRRAVGWLAATALAGLVFSTNKIGEYADLTDVTLSTNGFWFSYLFLTGLHLLHVVAGVVGFAWLTVSAARGHADEGEGLLEVQAGAVYWHLVDVVWLMLFPVLYLMHP